METLAFAVPIVPGKTDAWKRWNDEVSGPRLDDYRASRRRLGITTERAYHQQTPQGDMVVVYLEADNMQRALEGLATSQELFDVWFREQVNDLFNVDLAQQPPQFPPPELGFDALAR